jgi:hypothetical protein
MGQLLRKQSLGSSGPISDKQANDSGGEDVPEQVQVPKERDVREMATREDPNRANGRQDQESADDMKRVKVKKRMQISCVRRCSASFQNFHGWWPSKQPLTISVEFDGGKCIIKHCSMEQQH